ncbi:MAG: DUF1311 domain-containing protein [Alphaproteobacteria bacterium]|nr:DUF1311 domain-containing protein [Alphaproteobacteria bacterium]
MVAALLVAAPLAFAADAPKSAGFEACAAKAHGATFPLLHCYAQEMQARDDAVAAAYNAALAAAADPRTKGFIQASQTAWESYRNAWCEAQVSRSGSLARLKLMECRLQETAMRTNALKELVAR